MPDRMSKSQVLAHLADESGLSKAKITEIFASLEALAVREAKNVFILPNFGKLTLADKKARPGRNPRTGEAITIAAKRVVKFRLSKGIKDAILS
jgi:DNA-binding protein HU-beta